MKALYNRRRLKYSRQTNRENPSQHRYSAYKDSMKFSMGDVFRGWLLGEELILL